MPRTTRLVVAALSLAVLALPGCGAFPDTGAGLLGLRGEKGLFKGRHGFEGGHAGMGPHGKKGGHGFGLAGLALPGIALTADQQASLKAIVGKYKPADAAKPDQAAMEAKHAAAKAHHEALKAALTAATFDPAALRAALTPATDASAAKPQVDPAMLGEIRALLTDEQRATAIARLKEAAARPTKAKPADGAKPDHGARLAETLALTTDQQAKLAAVTAAHEAAKPAHDPATRHAAMIAFLETGDAAGLTAGHARPQPPVDAIVDFVGTLDATQRAKLADLGPLLGKGGPGVARGGHGFAKGGFHGHRMGGDGFGGHGPRG